MCKEQSVLIKKTGSGENAQQPKKENFEEKVQKTLLKILPKTKSMQTIESVFAE